jgi:hypothetical protein
VRGEVYKGFWRGSMRERSQLQDIGVNGRIILKWVFKKWDRVMDWIYLSQNRDKMRTPVNAVMKFRVP